MKRKTRKRGKEFIPILLEELAEKVEKLKMNFKKHHQNTLLGDQSSRGGHL